MSNLADGLETVEEGAPQKDEDVNSQSGFDSALAKLTGGEVPEGERAPEASVAAGLEIIEEPAPQQRNPDGTFAPRETPAAEETPPPLDEEAPGEQPLHEDPEIAAFLERYDGDTEKALKAALEKDKLVGRQGNELGDLRQQLAKLEGRFEEASRREEQPGLPVVDDTTLEWLEDNIAQNGGYATMVQVVENRPDLIESTLSLWEEAGDPNAFRFRTRWEVNKALEEFRGSATETPAAPAADPYLEQVKHERMAADAAGAVMSHVPAEQREAIKPHISAALEELPQEIAAGLFDAEKRTTYAKIVADVARSRMVVSATDDEATKRQEAAAASKRAAQVATGSLRPAAPAGSEGGELSHEERVQKFWKQILEAPTASISEGLTFGK